MICNIGGIYFGFWPDYRFSCPPIQNSSAKWISPISPKSGKIIAQDWPNQQEVTYVGNIPYTTKSIIKTEIHFIFHEENVIFFRKIVSVKCEK